MRRPMNRLPGQVMTMRSPEHSSGDQRRGVAAPQMVATRTNVARPVDSGDTKSPTSIELVFDDDAAGAAEALIALLKPRRAA